MQRKEILVWGKKENEWEDDKEEEWVWVNLALV